MPVKQQLQYELFADYFQFYLQDEAATGDLSESWTRDAIARLLAIAADAVGVGTARNMPVPVVVEVHDSIPADSNLEEWDQVNECSLEVPSGRIAIAGCTDYFPDAARIEVSPGNYRLRLYYGNLNSVADPNALEGEDHYKIEMWQAPVAPLQVLKQREVSSRASS